MRPASSQPSMSGSLRSRKMTSGRNSRAISRPSLPRIANRTWWPMPRRRTAMVSAVSRSSSTTRMRRAFADGMRVYLTHPRRARCTAFRYTTIFFLFCNYKHYKMPVRHEISEGRVPVKVYTDDVEPQARQQLVNISRLPIVHHHVAAMPDVHLGIGATVGSVIPTVRAIIPAAVGVDIGCGMMATRLSLTGNDFDERKLKKVFDQIS